MTNKTAGECGQPQQAKNAGKKERRDGN